MEKIFSDGIIFKRPRENAPDYIKGNVSIKVNDLVAFLNKHVKPDGWVNLTLKESKNGKLYFELDTWTKTLSTLTDEEKAKIASARAGEQTKKEVEDTINPLDIPF